MPFTIVNFTPMKQINGFIGHGGVKIRDYCEATISWHVSLFDKFIRCYASGDLHKPFNSNYAFLFKGFEFRVAY